MLLPREVVIHAQMILLSLFSVYSACLFLGALEFLGLISITAKIHLMLEGLLSNTNY